MRLKPLVIKVAGGRAKQTSTETPDSSWCLHTEGSKQEAAQTNVSESLTPESSICFTRSQGSCWLWNAVPFWTLLASLISASHPSSGPRVTLWVLIVNM